jgi:hypothetical protein
VNGRARILVAALLVRSAAAAASPGAVFTNTRQVEALAADGDTLWAATRGGIEVWDARALVRRRLYTTADGLADNAVRALWREGGALRARTTAARCELHETWLCEPARVLPVAVAGPRLFEGRRMTAEARVAGRRFVATADGLWLAGAPSRRLTADDQICSNHVVALAAFAGRTWFGSFDEGLCSFDGQHFARAPLPALMINDLLAVDHLLYVATTHGLFVTRDGQTFRGVPALDRRAVVDLASDGKQLWAVTPASLWRLPLHPGCGVPRSHWLPGGARALQAVDASNGVVWIATEDRGVLRFAGGKFQVLDRAAGLPSSWAIDVAATPDGGAYVGTLRDGLVRVEADGSARAIGGVDPWLLHVTVAGARVWVGTQAGAALIEDGRASALTGLPHPSVHALLPSGAGVWLATEGGTVFRPSDSLLGAAQQTGGGGQTLGVAHAVLGVCLTVGIAHPVGGGLIASARERRRELALAVGERIDRRFAAGLTTGGRIVRTLERRGDRAELHAGGAGRVVISASATRGEGKDETGDEAERAGNLGHEVSFSDPTLSGSRATRQCAVTLWHRQMPALGPTSAGVRGRRSTGAVDSSSAPMSGVPVRGCPSMSWVSPYVPTAPSMAALPAPMCETPPAA